MPDFLPELPVSRSGRYEMILKTLRDPNTYHPVKNYFFWIGFLWGLPIPVFFLWFHWHLEPLPIQDLIMKEPIHFIFMLHPFVFGIVSGMIGSILRQYVKRLKSESINDYLTGLYNHRFFREELGKRMDEAERYDLTFGLILLDLDHFKKVNDEFGHQVGDEVLKEFAKLLRNETRAPDQVFRYGGEEFSIILPETELEEATTLAERIREKVAIHDFGINRQVTVSGGVAEYPGDSTEENSLIQVVDERLYDAKSSGRNQISSGGLT